MHRALDNKTAPLAVKTTGAAVVFILEPDIEQPVRTSIQKHKKKHHLT